MTSAFQVEPCPEAKDKGSNCSFYRIETFDDGNGSLLHLQNRWRVLGPALHEGEPLHGKVVIENLSDAAVTRSISFWKLALVSDDETRH